MKGWILAYKKDGFDEYYYNGLGGTNDESETYDISWAAFFSSEEAAISANKVYAQYYNVRFVDLSVSVENEGNDDMVKRRLLEGIEYPEKSIYENYLKMKADKYYRGKFPLDDVNLHFSTSFGYSVIPKCYDKEVHYLLKITKIKLEKTMGHDVRTILSQRTCLSHQVYLHDIVMEKWLAEKEGMEIIFEIKPVEKEPKIVTF